MRYCSFAAAIVALCFAACIHRAPAPAPAPAAEEAHFSSMTLPPTINNGIGISDREARADRLWERRMDPEALVEATATWRALLANDPADHRARASLMRAYIFSAEGPLTLGDRQQSVLNTLHNALMLAEEALAASCQPLQQKTRDGLPSLASLPALCGATCTQWMFWYAVALTDFAMASDVTVLLAWQTPLVALWQDLIARGDSTGDAHAYLGIFYAHAPMFAGGSRALAKAHLEHAIRARKDDLRTQVWYAEYVLAPQHMRAASAQRLRLVVQADAGTIAGRVPEQELAQIRARQLLEHLDDLL